MEVDSHPDSLLGGAYSFVVFGVGIVGWGLEILSQHVAPAPGTFLRKCISLTRCMRGFIA